LDIKVRRTYMYTLTKQEYNIIYGITVRTINGLRTNGVYICGLENLRKDSSFGKFIIGSCSARTVLKDQIILIYEDEKNTEDVCKIINRNRADNFIIIIGTQTHTGSHTLEFINSNKQLTLMGKGFEYCNLSVPVEFKVLAIIHLFNEEDVIRKTVEHLLSQNVDVYLVDNWSDDSSYSIVEDLAYQYPKSVYYERFPAQGKQSYYDWFHQLERTEEISRTLDYDWYIHYDADEYRISPWRDVSLRNAIYFIDQMGFNLIENTVIDFKITDQSADSIFMKDTWFEFGHRPAHFQQTKTWKKSNTIELKSSGGHEAIVKNPKVFPLKILNRHYPLRSVKQAEKKIFTDRKPRFVKENKERGWHGHYNSVTNAENFISETINLIHWDSDTFEKYYIPFFTGCGIRIEADSEDFYIDNYRIKEGTKVILYGAGKIGKYLYRKLNSRYDVQHWVDINYEYLVPIEGKIIESPNIIRNIKDCYIIIAVEEKKVADEIKLFLMDFAIEEVKILWNPVKKKLK